MRGICISFNPRNVGTIWPEPEDPTPPVHAVPPGDTAFCFFFRPIFPYLRELYWFASCFESTPFVRLIHEEGGEERLNAAQMDVGLDQLNSVLHRPGTLPELAPYLYTDWINLIGLRCSEADAVDTAQRLARERGEFDRYVDENTEIAFHCMDGFWWEFYPRDSALLELVTRPLEGVAGVGIRPCDLRHREALFRDPAAS